MYKFFHCLLCGILLMLNSCGNPYEIEVPKWDYGIEDDTQAPDDTDQEDGLIYPEATEKVQTLQTQGDFSVETISPGLTYYTFNGYDDVSQTQQMVYVLELDLNNTDYYVDFAYTAQGDSLSSVMNKRNGIAGINAAYEAEAVYLKVNGQLISDVDLEPGHLRFWKHDGVIFGEGRKIGIVYGGSDRENSINFYNEMKVKNIFASSPMLIDNNEPVGETFVPSYYTLTDLSKFEAEDYRRHQGVRHPRTVFALTDDNDLLLIVIDGRRPGKAEGMNAREVTKFIRKHFAPRWALNMDGGGSSTMCIKGRGDSKTNVVNFPTDNGKEDHYGQRRVGTHIVIKKNN